MIVPLCEEIDTVYLSEVTKAKIAMLILKWFIYSSTPNMPLIQAKMKLQYVKNAFLHVFKLAVGHAAPDDAVEINAIWQGLGGSTIPSYSNMVQNDGQCKGVMTIRGRLLALDLSV